MMQYVLGGSCFSELNIHSFKANISQNELYYGIGEKSELKKKNSNQQPYVKGYKCEKVIFSRKMLHING